MRLRNSLMLLMAGMSLSCSGPAVKPEPVGLSCFSRPKLSGMQCLKPSGADDFRTWSQTDGFLCFEPSEYAQRLKVARAEAAQCDCLLGL